MAPHPQIAALLDLIAQSGFPGLESLSPQDARAGGMFSNPNAAVEEVYEVRDLDAGGVAARLYHPSAEVTGLLVFLHGGGWVIGDLESHDGTCRSLANNAGQAVLAIDYRLAPEHPFPAALGDCIQATRWAHANAASLRTDPARLAIGGDSAGGNLAAVIATMGVAPLKFQLLVYPVTDLRGGSASYAENGEGRFLTRASMEYFASHYLSGGEGSVDDPRVSPLLITDDALRTAPPGLVITAGLDPLRDEGEAYAARLNGLGIPCSSVRFGGQIHAFFSLPGISDGVAARRLAGAALRDAIG
jgi:acetyl esterase